MPVRDDQRGEGAPGADGARALGSAVTVVSLLTLLSRFAGLARDVIVVRVFGATAIGSAFNAAFAVPNFFRRLLGEGALSAAFLPEYAAVLRDDPRLAARFATLTIGLLTAASGALTIVGEVVVLLLLWLLPHEAERALSLRLIAVTLPYMPLICAAAILGGMLQVHGRFAAPAAGPILLNLFVIAAAAAYLALAPDRPVLAAYVISATTVAAGLAQALWSFLLLRPHVKWERTTAGAGDAARRMSRRFVPAAVGAGTSQINAMVDVAIAMWPIWVPGLALFPLLDEKSNSILSHTQRLYQFPLGVFGIAVATAVFPMLARHAASAGEFGATLRRGLRLSLFIGLPASVGLVLVREDLVHALFSGGGRGFDTAAAARSAAVLAGYSAGVWAYSLNHILVRAFYASGDTTTPMRVALWQVAVNIAVNLLLVRWLGERGLAWSTALCAAAQCVALGVLARRRLGVSLGGDGAAAACTRLVLMSALMGAGVWALMRAWGQPGAWAGHAARLAAACALGAALYLGLAAALGTAELRWLRRERRRK